MVFWCASLQARVCQGNNGELTAAEAEVSAVDGAHARHEPHGSEEARYARGEPRCPSALAELEREHEPRESFLGGGRYQLSGQRGDVHEESLWRQIGIADQPINLRGKRLQHTRDLFQIKRKIKCFFFLLLFSV